MHAHQERKRGTRKRDSFALLGIVAGIALVLSMVVSLFLEPFVFLGVLWAGVFVFSGAALSQFLIDRVLHGRPSWLRVSVTLVGGWALSAPLEGLVGLITRESGEAAFLPTVWLWGVIPFLIAEAVVVVYAATVGRAR